MNRFMGNVFPWTGFYFELFNGCKLQYPLCIDDFQRTIAFNPHVDEVHFVEAIAQSGYRCHFWYVTRPVLCTCPEIFGTYKAMSVLREAVVSFRYWQAWVGQACKVIPKQIAWKNRCLFILLILMVLLFSPIRCENLAVLCLTRTSPWPICPFVVPIADKGIL